MKNNKKKWKKILHNMRLHFLVFIILLVIGGISFGLIRTVLLKNSQDLGTSLAVSSASEMQNKLTVYETLLSFGEERISMQIQGENMERDLENWMQLYFNCIINVLGGETVDPYAVVNGKIFAANPWEGDIGYDYTNTDWYQQAVEADGNVIFTDVYTDAIYQKPVITLAQKSNVQDAVIAFDIFPENFRFETTEIELPEGGSFFLCDRKGTLVYSQTDLAAGETQEQEYLSSLFQSIKSGEQSQYDSSFIDTDGYRRGVYYKEMPNGWLSIITIPYSSILGDLNQFMAGFVVFFSLFFLILLFIAWRDIRVHWQMERTNETVRVLGNSYYAIYRVDYARDTYEMIKGSNYMRERIGSTGQYRQLLRTMTEVIEEDACQEYMESFSLENIQHLVEKRIRDFGGDFLRKFDDEYRWVNIRVLFDESLAPEEVVLCFREVDQEKRQQLQERKLLKNSLEASRQSEKSKQAFFSNMSHDMRTPLNAIIGLSELAERDVSQPERVKEYLRKIEISSQHLLELINDVLDMSRMEQGKVVFNNQQFSIQKCLEDCTESFRFQAEKEEKDFQVRFDLERCSVIGDPFRISQIINNLLSNAFKFTSAGDSISISVTQLEKKDFAKYKIVVQDTGIGMSEEFMSRLFDPYARETRFNAKKVAGTGLGMAIVKNLVDQMDGSIHVDSQLGKGSTFTVIVPFITVKEEKAPEQELNIQSQASFSLEGCRILLAEDNMINMEVATEILTMHGIDITQAWNGKEAVDLFQQSEPYAFDAILMDMQMPEMNGCDAAKAIRGLNRPDAKTIPIIAVTANAFSEDITATAEAGMDAHISKPIDFHILCRTLEKLIGKTNHDTN